MFLPKQLRRRLPGYSAFWRCLAGCALLLTSATFGAPEYEVKAAQTAKFASYIEWPASARGSTLVIGLVGRDPSAGTIEQALVGANVGGRRVELRRIAPGDTTGLRGCNIIFVSDAEADRVGDILRQVQGYPVLTVGESNNFATLGGMIEFIAVDGQIRFVANPRAAERSGLKLSSGLLRTARKVIGG